MRYLAISQNAPIGRLAQSFTNAVQWNIGISVPTVWDNFGTRGDGIIDDPVGGWHQLIICAAFRQYRRVQGCLRYGHLAKLGGRVPEQDVYLLLLL